MAKKDPAIIKRDTRENWAKANYIPKENVIIIMDNSNGTISLMIGDGQTNVNKLPDMLKEKAATAQATVDSQEVLIL